MLAAGRAGRPCQPAPDATTAAEAVWDADAVRDDVRALVVAELGAADGVLIVDDTDDLKAGSATVGVQR